MPNIAVAIINSSTVLNDQDIAGAVPALQTQVSEHLALAWGVDAALSFVPRGGTPPTGAWWLSILDNSDQAAFLGYHDVTEEGLPLGKAFAGSDLLNGFNWTITTSHELLEMLIDPDINQTVFVQDATNGNRLYAYEICDPCEADQYGYAIEGIMVSDFVFPSWFESFRAPASCQFDVIQRIGQPFSLLPGGYISVFDVANGTGWKQLNGDKGSAVYTARAPVGSRRERRHLSREQWSRSRLRNR